MTRHILPWRARLPVWFLLAAVVALFVPHEPATRLLGVCLALAVLVEVAWFAAHARPRRVAR
jgi:hypothetical protein